MDVVASNIELGVVASNVELGVAFIELCAAFVETGVF